MTHTPTSPLGARRVDHIALTVPNLDEAIEFTLNVLGGELVYHLPELSHADNWMLLHLDVHPRTRVEIALVRLGPVTNLEFFQYWTPGRVTSLPRVQDTRSTVLGLYVHDVDTAADFLRESHGLRCFGPSRMRDEHGPEAGTRWVRMQAPWGMPLELRSKVPSSVGRRSPALRRFGPCAAWSNRNDGTASACLLPGLCNVDHVSYAVNDLNRAVQFFEEVLGAESLYRTTESLSETSLAQALGVPFSGWVERAVLRLGPTDNLELTAWNVPGANRQPPRNSDLGGRHLALYVDDVPAAAAHIARFPGCMLLGTPQIIAEGPIAGDQWVYVRTPIGLYLELVRMPDGDLPYEFSTSARRRPVCGLRWTDR
jgi:catechol 2,3-dioxygenase-like lactoylglutathione lyase family enzyme